MRDVIVVNTDRGVQSGSSGYGRLVGAIGNARVVSAPRRDPRSFGKRLITRMIREGATSEWYRLGSLRAEWTAWKMIRHSPPDVIHFLWGDQDWGYLDRFLPATTALVITVHNPLELLPGNFRRTSGFARIDRVILMAPDQSEFFVSQGLAPEQCVFVPHGIDIDAFRPGSSVAGTTTQPLRVLHVGNYLRDFKSLAAVTRLCGTEIEFEIVCSEKIRTTHEFGNHVAFHHGIDDAGLLALYQNCELLLMTATGATANNALLEGLACGLPVIAQDVGGLGAYLDSECAILTATGDPKAIVNAIDNLKNDRIRRASMSAAARSRASTFNWDIVGAKTREVYEEAFRHRGNFLQQSGC